MFTAEQDASCLSFPVNAFYLRPLQKHVLAFVVNQVTQGAKFTVFPCVSQLQKAAMYFIKTMRLTVYIIWDSPRKHVLSVNLSLNISEKWKNLAVQVRG